MGYPEDWYSIDEKCPLQKDGQCIIAEVECDGNEAKCKLVEGR